MPKIKGQYVIVDVPQNLPEPRSKAKYRPLLDGLAFNKAIMFEFNNSHEAALKANGFRTCIRMSRLKSPMNYNVITRIVPTDGKYVLYIWKVKK